MPSRQRVLPARADAQKGPCDGLGGGGVLGPVEVGPVPRRGRQSVAGVGQFALVEGQALGPPVLLQEEDGVDDIVLLLLALLVRSLAGEVLDASAGLVVGAAQVALGGASATELDGAAGLILQVFLFVLRVPALEDLLVSLETDVNTLGHFGEFH